VAIIRRRRDPRPVKDWTGRYRFDGADGWQDCRVVDVMGSHVTVEPLQLEEHEPVERSVLLELASVSGAEPVQLRGEVRQVARISGGRVHLGIGFIASSAQAEQLLDLLFALRAAV
jgi:hypothetical protein